MDRSAVTQRVWELTEPFALTEGLELFDVQYRPEGGRVVVRLLLDRPAGGVTLDQLTRFSRQVGDLLEAHDAVPGAYHLECSSPGVNRPLLRASHWERAVGQRVRVRTRTPLVDNRRQFRGTLEAVTTDGVRVVDPDAGTVTIPLAEVEKANVDWDFGRPQGAPHAHA
jgi:ribosome maturation factor RimP